MKKRIIWILAGLIICVGIFAVTASPSATGGNTMELIAKWLPVTSEEAALINFLLRKAAHLSAFGLLAIFLYHCFRKYRFSLAWLLTTAYAATDEWHQLHVPGRDGKFSDVVLDSIGALLALYILIMVKKAKNK